MNYPIPPMLVVESDVTARIAQHSKPVLLSFTADWCQPCKSFAPVLGALHGKHRELIDVVRVDIDACPDLARHYGVRSVPTSVLLRDGQILDRFVGAKPERSLVQWLLAREIALLATPADEDTCDSFGAFYGDESLKQFLVERLCQHMDRNEVNASFIPHWVDGRGSVACTLVHHASPEVFERVTGLPHAFACALEFVRLKRRQDVEALFQPLAPGQDMRHVPLRLIRAWLGDNALCWNGALDSAAHETLRRDWLMLVDELLGGTEVSAQRWIQIRDAARALSTNDTDPYRQLEDDVAEILTLMSLPPDARDIAPWSMALMRAGFAMMRLTEYALGWSKEDIAKPVLRERFFRKHVPIAADGSFDQQLFETKRGEWERANADFLALEDQCNLSKRSQHCSNSHVRFQAVLADILRNS